MKKIIFSIVSAISIAAVADGVSSTEFAAMLVPSTAKKTIISVPWLESGTGDSPIAVSNLVLTSGLTDGTKLHLYNTAEKKYSQSWELTDGVWEAANESTNTIARGSALILERDSPSSGFYIMGKPFTGTEGTITLPSGTVKAPVYSLIAPPAASNVNINTGIAWTGITIDDSIIMLDGKSLVWDDGNWWKKVDGKWTKDNITIDLGTGVWFMGGSSGTKTFKLK